MKELISSEQGVYKQGVYKPQQIPHWKKFKDVNVVFINQLQPPLLLTLQLTLPLRRQ